MRLGNVLILAAFVAGSALAQSKVPDLAGFWERKDEFGGGSFGGTLERIPKAQVKQEVIEEAKRQAAAQAAGQVVSFGSKWCLTGSYPFFMQHSAAWDLVQGKDEIVLAPEVHTFARHIYLDGRKHPDPEKLIPSPNGHAIGRWEGETLVVDTIGFQGGGGTPGGGRVTKNSHLTERFKLVDSGKTLSVTYTWDDPGVYLKPHTYEMTYHRSDPATYAFEEYCHADDEAQGGSVVQPAQR
ncbi:MAG: hypothetical protein ABL967_01690 [Bryobacteraceae bacterium]